MNNIIKYKGYYQGPTLIVDRRRLGLPVLSSKIVKLRNFILFFILWLTFCTMAFFLDVNYGDIRNHDAPAAQLQLPP